MEQTSLETVLVTGATGFLGEYLVRRLTDRYRVLALGRNKEKGSKLESYGAVFCPADFTDRTSCAPYFQNVQYVIHAGALSSVWGEWKDFYRTNVQGTNLVSELCMENGVKRLVYISSPSIYTQRENQYNIKEEDTPETNDLNFYIKSKLMAETVVRKWEKKGLETVILRPRGLIGIGDTSLVPRLLRANSKIGIPLFNEGENLIDVTAVENVALACELAMTAKGASGKAFNITNGEPMEFRTLLEHFLDAIDEPPHYREMPFGIVYRLAQGIEYLYRTLRLPGEPPLTRYTVCTLGYAQTMDINRARTILGYHPEKTLWDAIQEYGAWWKETHPEKMIRKGRKEKLNTLSPLPIPYPRLVEKVKLYHCGSCTNNLTVMYSGKAWEKRNFPASAVLIQHQKLGNILFDTGYSEQILEGGIALKLYCLLNPVHMTKSETISEQLKQDGINPESVKTIILSHAHPDHIGGLSQFFDYELIASEEVLQSLKQPRLRNLMFRNFVPPKGCIRKARRPKNLLKLHFLCQYFDKVYDLFGDGSIIGVGLDGHCKGQLGIWIPDKKLFLAADACWGSDLVRATPQMRLIPRLIQNDFAAYKDTLKRICRLKRDYPQITVLFTHQTECKKNF